MSSNPYAPQPVGPSNFGQDFLEPTQQRLSVLAVMALVFACICFIPGTGALAVILGGAAAFFISSSNGRLRGMGLAIAGIVVGLLFTMLWIFMFMGVNSAMKQFTGAWVKPADSFMTALDKGDLTTARTFLVSEADKGVTDEMLTGFAKDYKAELGGYTGLPNKGVFQLFSAYSRVGPAMNGIQGHQNQGWIPIPAEFAKGNAALFMQIDDSQQPTQTGGALQLPMKNIGIGTNGGKTFWLIDPAKTGNNSNINIHIGGKKTSGTGATGSNPDGTPSDAADDSDDDDSKKPSSPDVQPKPPSAPKAPEPAPAPKTP